MRDHLVRWHQQYAEDGLVIIEIDGGQFESLDVVRRSVANEEIEHLVLWDEENRNHKRYGVHGWPTAYLIGADGKVVWEGNPACLVARPTRLQWFKAKIKSELESVRQAREE